MKKFLVILLALMIFSPNCFSENATIRTSWQSGNVSSFIGQHPTENSSENFNVNRCGGALIHLKKK